MKKITIEGKDITDQIDKLPFIIAEAGVNHEGDISKAIEMIESAAEAGADAIKFQSYKADKLAIENSPAYWDQNLEKADSQFELFKKYDKFSEKEYKQIAYHCKEKGIIFLSTPFDVDMVEMLDKYLPAYKIASADITNTPLIKNIAKKKKPIFLSTGASTISEIWKAVEVIAGEDNKQIVLLHCILNYPTDYKKANLGMIVDLKQKFSDYIIGYSDHTLTFRMNEVLGCSWLLGARVIEKHFTYDKNLPGNDHYHAMDKNDLRSLINSLRFMQGLLGSTEKKYIREETTARLNARRSLVAKIPIASNTIIKEDDIAIKRPGYGLSPELFGFVVGSTAVRNIEKDEIIKFGDFTRQP